MSLATEALLIGSYAAHLRGVLPAWRQGHIGDADFVCTRAAASEIMGLFGHPLTEHVPDRCFRIDRAGGMHIDIDLRGHLLPLVAGHADEMTIALNGIEITCLVARADLIAALRWVSRDLVPKAADKARLDVAGYEAFGISITEDLAAAAAAFRKPT